MDPLPPVTPEALAQALQDQFQLLCRDVADAVSRAPTGHVISHSEEPVRDLLGDFRQAVYQAALQLRPQRSVTVSIQLHEQLRTGRSGSQFSH